MIPVRKLQEQLRRLADELGSPLLEGAECKRNIVGNVAFMQNGEYIGYMDVLAGELDLEGRTLDDPR